MKIEGSVQELELFFRKFILAKKVEKEVTIDSTKIGEQIIGTLKETGKTNRQLRKGDE